MKKILDVAIVMLVAWAVAFVGVTLASPPPCAAPPVMEKIVQGEERNGAERKVIRNFDKLNEYLQHQPCR